MTPSYLHSVISCTAYNSALLWGVWKTFYFSSLPLLPSTVTLHYVLCVLGDIIVVGWSLLQTLSFPNSTGFFYLCLGDACTCNLFAYIYAGLLLSACCDGGETLYGRHIRSTWSATTILSSSPDGDSEYNTFSPL